MCEPVTIGLALSAASTVMQGYAAKQEGKYKEGVANYNTRRSENEAQREKNIGIQEENKQREATAQMQSAQRAQLAASGVDINTGSAANIQADTEMLGEIDALTIRRNYTDSSQAMMDSAELERAQGKAARKAGNNAFTGSLISAAGTALSSGVADKWLTPKSAANWSTAHGGWGNSGSFIGAV